jgi:type II secretion system protein H
MRRHRDDAGYTLTELLVVLAVMGLMVALAPPLLQSAQGGVRARAAAYHLAAQLQDAHDQAVDTGSTVQVNLSPAQTILFYPDGSATAAAIRRGGMTVSVAPISGRVTIGG